ncbi:DUF4394 domain-containing protein [Parvularcula sp. LCG005]|uniref:DUF4394 domain-containing protein n=1 Tax=Parvularcula sp. LCG005 TaxID=3078805 RepID=UPI0029429A29|nr:DUF4394 domain-containing protein [Parvularcula sp. LCG005]WOI54791.1 DUF4394 domain-containing protein [Parvularcula sp. LCG005]
MTHKMMWIGAASALVLASPAMAAPVAYTLGGDGTQLYKITDFNNPGSGTNMALTDAMGQPVSYDSLAYRPRTGQLYAYDDTLNRVGLVDLSTGVVTPIVTTASGTPEATVVATVGFDFNNAIDAARIVTTDDMNIVFFPNNSPANVTRFTDLFYAPGDVNEGADPSIFANAYTNAVPMTSTTRQFGLDSQTNSLVQINNNSGHLTTVGRLTLDGMTTLDFTDNGGFDILSYSEGDNTAYALLTTGGGIGLFTFALTANADGWLETTFLGSFGSFTNVFTSLAVFDDGSPVPIPAGALLFASGLGVAGALRRRKKAAA